MQISYNSKQIPEAEIKRNILGKSLFIKADDFYFLKNKESEILIDGDLFYFYDGKITEYFLNKTKDEIEKFLSQIVAESGWDFCRKNLEGNYNAVVFSQDFLQIQADRFKQKELFYKPNGGFFASTDLADVLSGPVSLNQEALVLVLSSWYQYCPAGETIYKNVFSLKPGEFIEFSREGFRKFTNLDLKQVESYEEGKMAEYEKILQRAILGRSSSCLNIANSTGGWDSTYIISVLVELLGKEKVKSSIFGYVLKDRKVWNIYEREKAQKIADYFGIEFNETKIDLNSSDFLNSLEELFKLLRSKSFYVNTLHHFLMYKDLKEKYKTGTIFSGEASDGLHNFGFTHWRAFFHESYPFKEYGDKLHSYLYSPGFFGKLKTGSYKSDMAFKLLKFISGADLKEADYTESNKKDFIFSYLAPLNLGQSRIPFEKVLTSKFIKDQGRKNLLEKLRENYLEEIIDSLGEENIYSCLIWIYKLFHFQGPTFKMLHSTANYHGFKMAIPFLDSNVSSFLEKMPADWGRGLEFRKTKYPLKVLAGKRNFPLEVVDKGIHSFPTEIDPSLKDETYNFYFNSPATDYFKEKLFEGSYRQVLDGNYFDLPFIDKEVSLYLEGKTEKISEPNSLIRLINFVSIGF